MPIYPYVYRLDHPVTGEFYIGYRCANKVPADQDLGHKYFTSSKSVKPRFNEFNCTIIAELFDKDAAYELEQDLINENWNKVGLLNKSCYHGKKKFSNNEKGRVAWNKGKTMSDDFRSKISNLRKGKRSSHSTRAKLSEINKGRTLSEHHKQKISEGNTGKVRSKETLDKMSKVRKGKPQIRCCIIETKHETTVRSFTIYCSTK